MNRLSTLFILTAFTVVLFSCEKATIEFKDKGVTKVVKPIGAAVDSVKFSTAILPIFTNDCLGCHDVGSTSPDLSAAAAYTSLQELAPNGGVNYINTATPASSYLYIHLTEVPNNHGGGEYQTQAATILDWISQGAKNN